MKREIFNFKKKEAHVQFAEFTSNTHKFSLCYYDNKFTEENSNKFFKTLDDAFHSCFKKIRIKAKSTHVTGLDIVTQITIILEQSLQEVLISG